MVGGHGRSVEAPIPGIALRVFPSRHDGGRRGVSSLIGGIRRGSFGLVVVLTRWIGHNDYYSIKRACVDAGARCEIVDGGYSMLIRVVRAAVATP